ncbi:TetR/AcrR family transcriptional regulator [Corynebacterium nasicanis]|uniref:TetR/AcrR family transcriptional regulator n=1 Tax=Corynebacterium nasicanis TaxID=1448267 RepID=A0ABW1QEG4_9CORY
MAGSTDRRTLRRERTRARIMEAAQVLISERGFHDVGVLEITEAADIGTGTFYNYFPSRDELLAAVAEESMEQVGAALDRHLSVLDDPAETYAGSLRHLVLHALTDRVWGGLFVQMGAAHPALMRTMGRRCRRDLVRGIEAGRFMIEDVDLAVNCTFGALVSALQGELNDEHPGRCDKLFARAMLRMVGVTHDDATEVTNRPLPTLSA